MVEPAGIAAFIQLLKSGRKPMFVVGAVCLALLLGNFFAANREMLFAGLFASIAFFVWDRGVVVCSWIGDKNAVARSRKEIDQSLKSLNEQELACLWKFIHSGQRTIKFPATERALRTLVRRGLIECEGGETLLGTPFGVQCTIADAVWDKLHEETRPSEETRP